jgi:hypothetical protein
MALRLNRLRLPLHAAHPIPTTCNTRLILSPRSSSSAHANSPCKNAYDHVLDRDELLGRGPGECWIEALSALGQEDGLGLFGRGIGFGEKRIGSARGGPRLLTGAEVCKICETD